MRNVGMGGGGIGRRAIVGPDHVPYQPGKARDWSGCKLVRFLRSDGVRSGKYRTWVNFCPEFGPDSDSDLPPYYRGSCPKVIPEEIGAFTTEISHVNLLTAPSPQPDKVYDSGELGKVSEGGGVDGLIDVPRLFMSWT